MTVKMYIDSGEEQLLSLYPKEEARALLGMALEHFCRLPSHLYYTDPHRPLSTACVCDLQNALEDLCRAKPIQYILGETLFEGCRIKVREGVLIPRPETAELVRWAKEELAKSPRESLHIIDLCTGSGAIAIALAKAFPKAKVYGADISGEALEVAEENNSINQTEVGFFKTNVLQPPASPCLPLPHSVDLVISNPPYVLESEQSLMRPNVLCFEPHEALFVPDDDPLLFYRAIAGWGKQLLTDKGLLMLEVNERMVWEGGDILKSAGFQDVTIKEDLNGKPRMCCAGLGTVSTFFPTHQNARSHPYLCQ